MANTTQYITITHWLPIITFCPVNGLPDLLYITVTFKDQFVELYSARKRIHGLSWWKRIYMEDLADEIYKEFPSATRVSVCLMLGKHKVMLEGR